MSTHTAEPPAEAPAPPRRRRFGLGDRVFSGLALLAGITIMVALAAVFVFLAVRGSAGLHADSSLYPAAGNFVAYAAKLLFGTVWAAVVAMVFAVPFSIGLALFVSHYAPRWLATPVAYVIDLLAAVPSVIFGLWGLRTLANAMKPVEGWLNAHLGFIPLFSDPLSTSGRSVLVAGLVLAVMIIPITTAICREVFAQTPRLNEEAALALGATRWEMIRYAVFPYARSGVIAGVMLGLGRALGETMAVTFVLGAEDPLVTVKLLTSPSPPTIASNIAQRFQGENTGQQVVLLATGLVLFVFTFAVNFIARWVVARQERKLA
ncbi:phosphate ABC transporter permease subunit PstC [Nocardioides sp. DS6]|uniref:Phosphate transport system permease protein n=1 Tax=Nocardioides eburneus TaxID=3231482 RepID=A0ABV3SXM4_9ACTN